MRRCTTHLATLASVLLLAGCSAGPPARPPRQAQPPAPPRTALPAEHTVVVAGTGAADLALATSRTLFHHAPAVVLADENDKASLPKAADAATRLGVPLLLTPGTGNPTAAGSLRAELGRLAPQTVVAVGAPALRWARSTPTPSAPADGRAAPAVVSEAQLPAVTPAAPLTELLVLSMDRPGSAAATATARASGARVLLASAPDPRASNGTIKALAGQPVTRVLALGSAFGTAEQLRRRVDTAATGSLLPGGRQVVFPGRRLVALYGHPGDPVLGSLGEQPVQAAIARARSVAAGYRSMGSETVVPAFEIITTVASSSAGPDGDYSAESSMAHLRPWVDAAREAGVYVVLDLQPGRTDFLTQAKRYAELLREPHVGLALDPEWRLKPDQRHMVQIGSVSAEEVNATAAWLAQLTREHKLPQKVLLLHQFRVDMITNRKSVNTRHDELAVVVHADGFGTPGQKLDTWHAIRAGSPPNVWWGWKNFYDEDQPTFTPGQTVAVKPAPVFISYQ
ncbi:MAG TPA: hypothetical protein VFM54_12115 [Micromonosporaceae bacterium]|nr:hypothetical protein [Micromonosporaceae bacterium]